MYLLFNWASKSTRYRLTILEHTKNRNALYEKVHHSFINIGYESYFGCGRPLINSNLYHPDTIAKTQAKTGDTLRCYQCADDCINGTGSDILDWGPFCRQKQGQQNVFGFE